MMGHFVLSLILKAIEFIFGEDLKKYFDKHSDKVWYTFLEIIILIGFIVIVILLYGIIRSKHKYSNNNYNDSRYSSDMIDRNNIKDPFSLPDYKGEKASGACPMCGYSIVVAKKSFKTGELYFSCASTKKDKMRSCNFNGRRSY
jgi:amino acid permease